MMGALGALVGCGRPNMPPDDDENRVAGPDKIPKRGIDLSRIRAAFNIVPEPFARHSARQSKPLVHPLVPVPCVVSAVDGSIGVSCNPADISARGLKVEQVDVDGPSASVIKPGDRIVSVGDVDIDRTRVDSAMLALAGYIAACPSTVRLVVLREFRMSPVRTRDQIVKDLEKQLIASQLDGISPVPSEATSDDESSSLAGPRDLAEEFEQVSVEDDFNEEADGLEVCISPQNLNCTPETVNEMYQEVEVRGFHSPPEKSTTL